MLFIAVYCHTIAQTSPVPAAPGIVVVLNPGSTITLRANVAGAVAWQWFKDGEPMPMEIQSILTVSAIGSYYVMGFNSNSCASPASDPVRVVAGMADVSVVKSAETKQVVFGDAFIYQLNVVNKGPNTATGVTITDTLPASLVFRRILSTTTGRAGFNNINKVLTWNIDSLLKGASASMDFEVTALKQGKVVNTALVTALQQDPDMTNNISISEKTILGLKIPNVFTPDGDGKNDQFVIPNLLNYPDNDIIIFNRWGNSVYEKHSYQNDWNGQGLNEGTYFYILRVRYGEGQQDTYNGYVTLLRGKKN